MRRHAVPLLLAVLTVTALPAAPPIRVLFIGNSLTYFNELPATVEAIAAANGERIETTTVAFPDFSLEDHWKQGDARIALARTKWSFVVLQQGPSSLPESRALLVEYARRFSDEAKRAGAKTALFMVWPSSARARDFDGVKFSYQTAAREIGGLFLPAGEAWRRAWRQDPHLTLYGPDGFHPSPLGSLLAALVIYQGLTGKSAARLLPGAVPVAESATLLSAAAQALEAER